MNETILNGLLNLFAIFASLAKIESDQARQAVNSYLTSHFGIRSHKEYMELFEEIQSVYDDPEFDIDRESVIINVCNQLKPKLIAEDNMSGGTEVQMVGYAGYADIHNLTPAHFNDHTNIADTKYETTILQNRVAEPGYYGSPAFLLENGSYKVVGFMVGSIEGKDRLVPIRNLIH